MFSSLVPVLYSPPAPKPGSFPQSLLGYKTQQSTKAERDLKDNWITDPYFVDEKTLCF